jgi:hypothetical protein
MSVLLAALLAAVTNDLEGLRFLEGNWTGQSGKMVFEERWTDDAGGTMLGLARTLSSGKTVAFEFLRIEARDEGIFYVAQPGGNPPTEFQLTRLSADEVVFENPQHDHPKIIRYRLGEGGSALTAAIEGDEGKQEFRFERSKAP